MKTDQRDVINTSNSISAAAREPEKVTAASESQVVPFQIPNILIGDETIGLEPMKETTVPCEKKALAPTYTPTKEYGGKPIEVELGEKEFGNTSKLAASFNFGACRNKSDWKFYLKKLDVAVDSKVQPEDFRINIKSAESKDVDKDTYPTVIKDLSPTRKVTMSVSCAGNKFEDEVPTYSKRAKYWNQEFVIDHEAFHRKDWNDTYRAELISAEKKVWDFSLAQSEASTESEAVSKANKPLTAFMIDAYQNTCKTFTPKKESRAYADGAAKYQQLIDNIEKRKTKEKW